MADNYEDDYFDGGSDDDGGLQDFDDHDLLEDRDDQFDSEESDDDRNGFLDLEASEVDSDSDVGSEGSFDAQDRETPQYFPRFMELPVELREMVWKAFCPDLDTRPRVFELHCIEEGSLLLGAHVELQTVPTRAVLAVHRESRLLGLKYSPHSIELPRQGGFIPYHKDRDIIFIDMPAEMYSVAISLVAIAEIAPDLRNLAVSHDAGRSNGFGWDSGLRHLPQLQNIFIMNDAYELPTKSLSWCVSERCQLYHISVEEVEPGVGECMEMVFGWPNPDLYGESGEFQFTHRKIGDVRFNEQGDPEDSDSEEVPEGPHDYLVSEWALHIVTVREELQLWALQGVQPTMLSESPDGEDVEEIKTDGDELPTRTRPKVWPMTRFMFDSGIQRLEDMKAWQGSWKEWVSDTDSLDVPNEYESDGIDDEPVDDFSATDEEDDLPAHLLDQELLVDGSSSGPEEMIGLGTAQFSSDSEEATEEDSSHSDNEEPRRIPGRLKRRIAESDNEDTSATQASEVSRPTKRTARTIVDDSDDEDVENGEEAGTGPIRGAIRSRRIISVDSDDEDEDAAESSRAGNGRARAIPLSSDASDDDADSSTAHQPPRAANRRPRPAAPSDSEDEESDSSSTPDGNASPDEEEEGSDEEPAAPKRISLAKRLRMEHQRSLASRPGADNSDEDGDSYGGDSDGEDEDASDGLAGEGEEDVEDEDGW